MDRKEKLEMLRKPDEERLTTEILIPLFERMCFKNVLYTHGVLECGRDIIYCEETKFLKHKYVGVQVKSGDVDTKVAEKLFTQVARGIGGVFKDLSDNNKEKPINEFIILCSGEIKENARQNMSNMLDAIHVDKSVSFITGEDLIRLLDDYMPSAFWDEYDYFSKYFNAMREDFATIKDISAIGQKDDVPLESIYVSPKLTDKGIEGLIREEEEWKIFKSGTPDKEDWDERANEAMILDAERTVGEYNRLVIIGLPGSGKTTLMKYITLKYCRENLEKQDRTCVPIPIILRELAESGETLRSYIDIVFKRYKFPKANKFVEQLLKQGKCKLMLDGFDELATKERQSDIVRIIEDFSNEYKTCQLVITSRPAGYHDELKFFRKLEILEFDEKQVREFIDNWFGESDPEKAESMFVAIQENDQIRALAGTPLMIAIIAIIYEEDKKLPERRVDLYKRCVEVLLSRWDVQKRVKNKYPLEKKEFILRKLAFSGHINNKRIMTEEEVMKEMQRYLPQIGLEEQNAKEFLNEIWQRSYLLRQISQASYDFLHLSFQEYFTALELKENHDGLFTIIKHVDEPWWEEPILLYAGINRDASALIRIIQEKVPEDIFFSNLILFGKLIVDADFTDPSLKDEIIEKLWSLYESAEFRLLSENTITILSRIIPNKVADSLLGDLRDGSFHTTKHAEKAIRNIKSERGIDTLIESLITDKDSDVRKRVAGSLGYIGSERALEPLFKALRTDIQCEVRASAAEALGWIRSEKALKPLARALTTDKEYIVRSGAADAIGRIGSEQSLELLTKVLKVEKDSYVRKRVVSAIGDIGQQGSEKAFEVIAKTLNSDKNGDVRGSAADAMGYKEHENAIEPLIKALTNDKHRHVQICATGALGRIGSEKSLEVLIKILMTNKSSDRRMYAAHALRYIGSEKAIEPLVKAFTTESNSDVRGNALGTLGYIGSARVVETLIEALMTDFDDHVRRSAAHALGYTGSEKAIEPLIVALMNDNTNVRADAAESLGRIGSEKVVELLGNSLITDKHSSIRRNAAHALGDIGSKRAIEPLKQALRDEDMFGGEKVKDAAFAALEKISRRNSIRITCG